LVTVVSAAAGTAAAPPKYPPTPATTPQTIAVAAYFRKFLLSAGFSLKIYSPCCLTFPIRHEFVI